MYVGENYYSAGMLDENQWAPNAAVAWVDYSMCANVTAVKKSQGQSQAFMYMNAR